MSGANHPTQGPRYPLRETDARPDIYEGPYWVCGEKTKGCISAENEIAARALFKELTGEEAVSCKRLPYHAQPRLNYVWYPYPPDSKYAGKKSCGESLCFDPDNCAGYSSCPKRRACSE